jgi:SWI/SNF-related matrix-associated actin-dependent regulator 1 of chromatin subfamily A
MEAYRMSGMAKIKAVKEYIMEILENKIKILVFAHHRKILDEIENELNSNKIKFMRIDG